MSPLQARKMRHAATELASYAQELCVTSRQICMESQQARARSAEVLKEVRKRRRRPKLPGG